jgi:hypothetical protein
MLTEHQRQRLTEIKALALERDESIQEVLEGIREARDRRAPLVAFVHIPKTAGATAINMLVGAYSRPRVADAGNFMTGPEKVVSRLQAKRADWPQEKRVVAGHVPYAIFREQLPLDTRYMTFLREPVDRVLSHYYRHIHKPVSDRAGRNRRNREEGKARAASLEEALIAMRVPQLSNLATRFLSGHRSMTDDLPASALDEAQANLREFAFVGIQERFEESIVLLQRTFGLGLHSYWNRHVSLGRPSVEEISDQQRAMIEEHNELDLELYGFASELFEDAVTASDEAFADDVKRLRDLATNANDEAIDQAEEWLARELPAGSVKLTAELREAGKEAGFPGPALKNARARLAHAGRRSD